MKKKVGYGVELRGISVRITSQQEKIHITPFAPKWRRRAPRHHARPSHHDHKQPGHAPPPTEHAITARDARQLSGPTACQPNICRCTQAVPARCSHEPSRPRQRQRGAPQEQGGQREEQLARRSRRQVAAASRTDATLCGWPVTQRRLREATRVTKREWQAQEPAEDGQGAAAICEAAVLRLPARRRWLRIRRRSDGGCRPGEAGAGQEGGGLCECRPPSRGSADVVRGRGPG